MTNSLSEGHPLLDIIESQQKAMKILLNIIDDKNKEILGLQQEVNELYIEVKSLREREY